MQPALALRDVTFAYPRKPPVLRGASLSVAKGSIHVVMGANGSGKTTLLRIAAGLASPATGRAELADGASAHEAMRRGRIGFIPQHLGLVRSGSVLENVMLGGLRRTGLRSILGLHDPRVRDEAEKALDLVGLREKAARPVKTLSGGERQRAAIARTLVQKPEVIVADELIASLDAVHQHAIVELARRLTGEGTALVLALHQIDVALTAADEISFLAHGTLSPPRRPHELTPEEARSALLA